MRIKSTLCRFLSKVSIGINGCWIWTAARDRKNYGSFHFPPKESRAHRVAWILFIGPIPNSLLVLHKCDNPACVNPDHLFIGTQKDNIQDCLHKGRLKSNLPFDTNGERNSHAKLTNNDILVIRQRAQEGEKQCKIAEDYKISFQAVSRIVKRERWNHV